MLRANSYTFVATYVKALKPKLLTDRQFEILLSRDEQDAIRVLSDTYYARYIARFAGKPFGAREF